MKLTSLLIGLLLTTGLLMGQEVYFSKTAKIHFHSEAPLENIEGNSDKGIILIDNKKKEVTANILIRSFYFENSLMREHFNEKYLESHKYPMAKFKGKYDDELDLTLPGEYEITVRGKLEIHGESENRIVNGKIIVDEKGILMTCDFDVNLNDHNIDVPSILTKNIADVVQIKIKVDLAQAAVRQVKNEMR